MFNMGITELILIGVVAILLFGRDLPSVAKSVGRMYRDFRNGLASFTKEMDFDLEDSGSSRSYSAPKTYSDYDDFDEATAPKFEPPKSEPTSDAIKKPIGEKDEIE